MSYDLLQGVNWFHWCTSLSFISIPFSLCRTWGNLIKSSYWVTIHPSVCSFAAGYRCQSTWWQKVQQSSTDVLYFSHNPQILLGNPEAFPDQMGYTLIPVCFESGLESPQGDIQRCDQIPKPPQSSPFNLKKQHFYSLLALSLRVSLYKLWRKLILASCVFNFSSSSYYPEVVVLDNNRNV